MEEGRTCFPGEVKMHFACCSQCAQGWGPTGTSPGSDTSPGRWLGLCAGGVTANGLCAHIWVL